MRGRQIDYPCKQLAASLSQPCIAVLVNNEDFMPLASDAYACTMCKGP